MRRSANASVLHLHARASQQFIIYVFLPRYSNLVRHKEWRRIQPGIVLEDPRPSVVGRRRRAGTSGTGQGVDGGGSARVGGRRQHTLHYREAPSNSEAKRMRVHVWPGHS